MKTENILPYTISHIQSEKFYQTLTKLSLGILEQGNEKLKDLIKLKQQYSELNENPNNQILELLTIGTLWSNYIGKAILVTDELLFEVEKLKELTIKFPDNINFKNSYLILRSRILQQKKTFKSESLQYSIKSYYKLINWLKATNEYTCEIQILENWGKYWKNFNDLKFTEDLCKIISFTHITFAECYKHLDNIFDNRYFTEVIPELNEEREDYFQVTKPKEEYYLNFLAAEIMNMQAEKSNTADKTKTIFAPACMRINNGIDCRANKVSGFFKCIQCNSDCNVYKLIDELGADYEVNISLHQSTFNIDNRDLKKLHVIGIACAGCLLSGGLMLKSKGVEANCLILNKPGCKKHWSKTGESTNISSHNLNSVLCMPQPSSLSL